MDRSRGYTVRKIARQHMTITDHSDFETFTSLPYAPFVTFFNNIIVTCFGVLGLLSLVVVSISTKSTQEETRRSVSVLYGTLLYSTADAVHFERNDARVTRVADDFFSPLLQYRNF
jgi:hypothetical protein